jgi:hypothetical protein
LRFWDLGWSLLDRIPIDDAKRIVSGQTAEGFGYRGIKTSVLLKDIFIHFLAFKSSYFKGYLECSGIFFLFF